MYIFVVTTAEFELSEHEKQQTEKYLKSNKDF